MSERGINCSHMSIHAEFGLAETPRWICHNCGLRFLPITDINNMIERLDNAEITLVKLRNAVCLNCGKSLPPDGDCYACEVDRLNSELEHFKTMTYCAYCGDEFSLDCDASLVSNHIKTCSEHPMREVEAELKETKQHLTDLAYEYNNPYDDGFKDWWASLNPDEQGVHPSLAIARSAWVAATNHFIKNTKRTPER